jgi:hypothetical protein
MKESIDDRITKRIKEVMEQYEPGYSPQAWENLRKQMPVPVFWLRKLFLKYGYWFSGVAIIGVLVIVYKVTSVRASDNNSAIDPVTSESVNSINTMKPEEKTLSEKGAAIRYSIPDFGNSPKKKIPSSKVTPGRITNSLPAVYLDYTLSGNTIEEKHESIEINSVIPVSFERIGFASQANIKQLIPIKYEAEEIPALKSSSSKKTAKSEFQWPEFDFIFKKEEGYDKFAGPNKLAIFYSPELLHSSSLKSLGVAHGIGISFEGPIRSSVSISAGLSFGAIDFHKTISPVKVSESPDDTINIESGSYKYLEVPVSLNFKFFESTRAQIWLGTGISSIVFIKQNYTSERLIGGISDQVIKTSAKGWENILPLSSLNLSLLYRYQFSNRFSLHSSLLYKYHLVRLGYNSTKLNRFNLQIGLVYRFGRED